MSGRIFRLDIPAHQAVQELLPWFVSAQLGAEETARVQEHLLGCAECQREVEDARHMRARGPGVPEGVDVERALARLMPRLGAQEKGPLSATDAATHSDSTAASISEAIPASASAPMPQPSAVPAATQHTAQHAPASSQTWSPRSAANQPAWMRWALAIQGMVIAGLLAWQVWPGAGHADYHALGAAGNVAGNLVVVFKPETAEKELRRVLLANGARVVDGPTDTDAYLLSVPLATRDRAMLNLRAEPSVMLVESLQAGAPP